MQPILLLYQLHGSDFVLKSADNPSLTSDIPGTIESSKFQYYCSIASVNPVNFAANPVEYTLTYAVLIL